MRSLLGVATIAVSALMAGTPIAEALRDPGSYATTRAGRGPITIDANVIAPESCYAAVQSGRDGPSFLERGEAIIPVTIALDRVGGNCVQTPTVVRSRFAITGDSSAYLVEIKFVTLSGSVLKVERVAISGR